MCPSNRQVNEAENNFSITSMISNMISLDSLGIFLLLFYLTIFYCYANNCVFI